VLLKKEGTHMRIDAWVVGEECEAESIAELKKKVENKLNERVLIHKYCYEGTEREYRVDYELKISIAERREK
jgi:hypothetical protein